MNSTRNNNNNNNNHSNISYNFPNDNISNKSDKILRENNDTNIYYDHFSEGNANNYSKINSNFDINSMNTINNYQEEKPLDLSKILKKENPENRSKNKKKFF